MSVRHALLALLSEGPKYGLQLRQEFEAKTGEVWPLNVGQVYTTLQRLERDGLVESDDTEAEGPQKTFHLTDDGAEELHDWLRTPGGDDAPADDLGLALVADAEIFRLEAQVRWLDAADVRLKRFPVTPAGAAAAATPTPVTRRARRAAGVRR